MMTSSLLWQIVGPWATAILTVDDLWSVLDNVPVWSIALTMVTLRCNPLCDTDCAIQTFGFLWGVGCVLFGSAVTLVGNSLAFSIILVRKRLFQTGFFSSISHLSKSQGLCTGIGAVLPLVIFDRSDVGKQGGICTWSA